MRQERFRRVEQKYLFPAGHTEMILAWLQHACLPDPRFPSSTVSSLYYDTPGLFHFYESRNGDFVRAKVRLRWYEGPFRDIRQKGPDAAVRCYLEVKTKEGALSEKKRTEVTIPSRVLYDDPFSSSQILDLPARVLDLDFRPSGPLLPVLIVEYRRQRYLDTDSQASIAVDADIRCTQVNGTVVPGIPPVYFDVGVLESKGMNRNSNGVLNPIASCLTKSPFSKYGISLESLMKPLGRRV